MLKLVIYPIQNRGRLNIRLNIRSLSTRSSHSSYFHLNVISFLKTLKTVVLMKVFFVLRVISLSIVFLISFLANNVLSAAPAKTLNASSELDNQPVNIQSDSAHFDEQKGVVTHSGNVTVTQMDRLLTADSLEIHRNKNGKIDCITAKGNPASFETAPEPNKPKMLGKANTLKYFPKENKIILIDSAELKQDDKTLQGAFITYHLDSQTLVSDASENQRTTIILERGE